MDLPIPEKSKLAVQDFCTLRQRYHSIASSQGRIQDCEGNFWDRNYEILTGRLGLFLEYEIVDEDIKINHRIESLTIALGFLRIVIRIEGIFR